MKRISKAKIFLIASIIWLWIGGGQALRQYFSLIQEPLPVSDGYYTGAVFALISITLAPLAIAIWYYLKVKKNEK